MENLVFSCFCSIDEVICRMPSVNRYTICVDVGFVIVFFRFSVKTMRTQRQPIRALDKLDHKILKILQQDGRIAMKELAEQVGLSVTPCIERVKRMERDGVITGYHARVNPAELGAALLVFVEITLDHKSGNMFDQFRREVQKIPEVLECHLVSGDFDYLIKARIGEMADYRKLLGDILLQLPGAVQSKSYVVMEEIKETLNIAVGE
ncbi:transcriptional regulator, AsnC family [Paraburkholderia steynii]|uniref:Transcriptional regulator, AsnC family n=3 Tax=Paraburkholderia TaxID=1822464 RepID=A0A7Z7FGE2_9BURK|nr:transcriptional regulator, AsnC family [Paraburkholderia steynii]